MYSNHLGVCQDQFLIGKKVALNLDGIENVVKRCCSLYKLQRLNFVIQTIYTSEVHVLCIVFIQVSVLCTFMSKIQT